MSRNIDKLKILKQSREFTVILDRIVEHFSRNFKFTVGDRIVLLCEEMREQIIAANHDPSSQSAAGRVYDALEILDKIEDKLQLSLSLGLLSIDQLAMLCEIIDDIRKTARGWRRYFLRLKGVNVGVMTDADEEFDAIRPAGGEPIE